MRVATMNRRDTGGRVLFLDEERTHELVVLVVQDVAVVDVAGAASGGIEREEVLPWPCAVDRNVLRRSRQLRSYFFPDFKSASLALNCGRS